MVRREGVGSHADDATGEQQTTLDPVITALRAYKQTGDLAIRDQLVEQHMGLVLHLAKRFVRQAGNLDDLVQTGSIALMRAIEGFDAELGFRFSTYASTTIIGELKRYLRDKGWAVRPPRRVQELYLELGHTTATLTQRLGRPPTVAELARDLATSESDVLEAMEAGRGYATTSLEPSEPGEGGGRHELGDEDLGLRSSEARIILAAGMDRLSDQDRKIVELRYFEDLTQAEIGERLGISQMHVSRRLARALVQLRQVLSVAD